MRTLTRGGLARRCGVSAETIRYYEQQGLIEEPSRSAANYRLYDEATVGQLHFIKRAKDLGFTLREIKELLCLRASPRTHCGDIRSRAQEKIASIDTKVRALLSIRTALESLVRECRGSGRLSCCPILDALDPEEAS